MPQMRYGAHRRRLARTRSLFARTAIVAALVALLAATALIALPLLAAAAAFVTPAAGEAADRANVVGPEIDPDAALEPARQDDRAVANSNQPAHREPDLFEQPTHFAIAAFGDDDTVPMVRALAATVFDRAEACRLAIDR